LAYFCSVKDIIYIICFMLLFKPVLPVLDYVLNYDFITSELCLNREIPVKGCNGKCYLMSQLALASDFDKPLSTDKKHTVYETNDLFFDDRLGYTIPSSIVTFEDFLLNVKYSNLYQHNLLSAIFHPPILIS